MSVVRDYHFPWSSTVSWEASQTGGTQTVSGSVDVEVVVDTAPVKASATALAGAMAALAGSATAAGVDIVREKAEAASRISGALASGFFRYIRYGVGAKLMELASRIPALLESLRLLSGNGSAARAQMQRDFRRISRRYADIFDNLDRQLRSSLGELDAPVFEAADAVNDTVFGQALSETTSRAVLSGPEELDGANSIRVAGLKRHAADILEEGVRNIRRNLALNRRIGDMLATSGVPGEHAVHMPVIVLSASRLDAGGVETRHHMPAGFPRKGETDLDRELADRGPAGFLDIRDQDAVEVDRFFRKRLSGHVAGRPDLDGEAGRRFSDEVLRLWEAAMKTRNPIH